MRILLMSSAEKGHLNPLVGVAQWLLRDGHQVGWLTLPEPAPALAGLGVEILALEGQPPPPPLVTGGAELARLVLDREALRGWIRTLLLDAVPSQVEPVRDLVRRFQPDLVGLDGMLYQGVIAAHLEGVPCAGLSSALTLLELPGLDFELLRTVRSLAAERRALFRSYGLDPDFRTCECLSPRLNVIFATAALVGDDAPLPPASVLVGPSIPPGPRGDETDFPWHRLRTDRRLVYVSFGSQISWQPDLIACVAEAAEPLGVQLVVSAGDLAATDFPTRLPADAIVVPYAPQLALLERAAAMVSHGGANSVMEAMVHGVPMLLIPVCNDQPLQAAVVTRAGAGLSLERETVTVAGLRAVLVEVLAEDAAPRRNALRVRASYRAQDGARTAAALLTAPAR